MSSDYPKGLTVEVLLDQITNWVLLSWNQVSHQAYETGKGSVSYVLYRDWNDKTGRDVSLTEFSLWSIKPECIGILFCRFRKKRITRVSRRWRWSKPWRCSRCWSARRLRPIIIPRRLFKWPLPKCKLQFGFNMYRYPKWLYRVHLFIQILDASLSTKKVVVRLVRVLIRQSARAPYLRRSAWLR